MYKRLVTMKEKEIIKQEITYSDEHLKDLYMKVDDTFATINTTTPYLSWDEYFANIAMLAALRSKDENTKVGAVIVSSSHKLLGMGYNGLPSGIDESQFPTAREGKDISETKYCYTIHAEQNALCNTTVFDLTGSSIYVTLFPCCYCASILIQRGIKEVIYLSDKHHNAPEYVASRKLFDAAGVVTRQYDGRVFCVV